MGPVAQERVLAALREAAAYPHPADEIRAIRTHVSLVFLAGELAYKVKREVRFPFLDQSTLERRRLCCEEEVRLNRRLSPELYLGVVPITADDAGIHVGGSGTVVEYAVKMRRLPEDRMLDTLLRAGRFPRDAIGQIAQRLARFHAEAESTAAITAFGAPLALAQLWEEHFAESASFIGDFVTGFQDALLRATSRAWLDGKRALLEQRQAEGRIRDGHGDLRCSSICLTEPIQIFDCLEFSPRLRCGDVASDLAFLAMDLTWRGRRDLANELVRRYSELSADGELAGLIPFYASYRACVRAKVSALSAGDAAASVQQRAQARADALELFALACRYAGEDRPPVLVVVSGLSGTGKSTIAGQLAQALSARVLSTDRIRKELHGAGPTERHSAPLEQGIYSEEATRRTYAALAERAGGLLRSGHPVIADGTFSRAWQRELLTAVAERAGALRFLLELRADPAEIRRRLDLRRSDASAVSDADWPIFLAQRAGWEPIDLPDWDHPIVSAEGAAPDVLRRVKHALSIRLEPAHAPEPAPRQGPDGPGDAVSDRPR